MIFFFENRLMNCLVQLVQPNFTISMDAIYIIQIKNSNYPDENIFFNNFGSVIGPNSQLGLN